MAKIKKATKPIKPKSDLKQMVNNGEVAYVHPNQLASFEAAGWRVVK
jgi:hypothetical protein